MSDYRGNDYVGSAPKGWGIVSDYFATKYDSAADEVIALLADEMQLGNRDSQTGDVDAPTGWFALVHIPADVDLHESDDEVAKLASEYGVTVSDVAGSHIVTHNSQGFVYVETFESVQAADDEYACRAGRYAEWSEHNDTCGTVDSWSSCSPDGCDWDGIYVCPVTGHGYHSAY